MSSPPGTRSGGHIQAHGWPEGITANSSEQPSLPSSGMTLVQATHTLPLRGEAEARRVGAVILDRGSVLVHSEWVIVKPGGSINVEIDLTAEPGSHPARQATNVGGRVYENIVTIDLRNVEHP